MLDYTSIKELAKQIGRSVDDLLAQTSVSDPFYAGVPHRNREGEWFAEIWHRFDFSHGVHLRRIHYILVSQDEGAVLKPKGKPYRNTENDWALLGRASLVARYRDLIPATALVDRRNDEPMIFAESSLAPSGPDISIHGRFPTILLPDFDRGGRPPLPHYWSDGFYSSQNYVIEVWIEKSTQNDWLVPLCRRHNVNLVVGIGELSEVRSRQLVERASQTGKPLRIIYLSDLDPAGRSMPLAVARKAEFHIRKSYPDVDMTLTPLILTEEQCQQYSLPRTPIKETERRRDKFEEKFGTGATELDALEALHPGEMGKLLKQEIGRYLDPTLYERVRNAEWSFDRRLEKIAKEVIESHQDEIDRLTLDFEAVNDAFDDARNTLQDSVEEWEEDAAKLWSTIAKEMEEKKPDPPETPTPEPADEPDNVLFDSKRDYLTQMDRYREWQRR